MFGGKSHGFSKKTLNQFEPIHKTIFPSASADAVDVSAVSAVFTTARLTGDGRTSGRGPWIRGPMGKQDHPGEFDQCWLNKCATQLNQDVSTALQTMALGKPITDGGRVIAIWNQKYCCKIARPILELGYESLDFCLSWCHFLLPFGASLGPSPDVVTRALTDQNWPRAKAAP